MLMFGFHITVCFIQGSAAQPLREGIGWVGVGGGVNLWLVMPFIHRAKTIRNPTGVIFFFFSSKNIFPLIPKLRLETTASRRRQTAAETTGSSCTGAGFTQTLKVSKSAAVLPLPTAAPVTSGSILLRTRR